MPARSGDSRRRAARCRAPLPPLLHPLQPDLPRPASNAHPQPYPEARVSGCGVAPVDSPPPAPLVAPLRRLPRPLAPPYLLDGAPVRGGATPASSAAARQRPFGRLWWDETVWTMVTRAEPHNQAMLQHPGQARVLTAIEGERSAAGLLPDGRPHQAAARYYM